MGFFGAGPVVQIATISSATLGSNVWGGGPSAVIVYMTGPWVAGALANNIWSLGGTGSSSYSTFLGNPFVAYNFDDGWYVISGPNIVANWRAEGTKWTVPIGGGAGRTFRVGALPVDIGGQRLLQRRAARRSAPAGNWRRRWRWSFRRVGVAKGRSRDGQVEETEKQGWGKSLIVKGA